VLKRAFDVSCALIGLVVSSPFVLVAAIAVKLDSPGPAFYRGARVGLDGSEFRMIKLRSMVAGSDHNGPSVTVAADPRVTRVGRFLRRSKLDELPQLINVLRGDMSLVGPRPEHADFVKLYTPEQRKVLSMRPGITGPAAIAFVDEEAMLSGSHAETIYESEVMPRKLALDLDYVAHHSFAGDVRLLGRTAALVVTRAIAKQA
jgi:lipopolysaccharide/colanic/teichoic acid biosynthesis glycosyltransferase